MDIQHKDDGKQGLFYIEKDSKTVAEMEYHWQGRHTLVITHTQVDDSLQGEGVGKQLVKEAVEFARKRNLTIIPQCPFARKVIDDTPEYQDVLKP